MIPETTHRNPAMTPLLTVTLDGKALCVIHDAPREACPVARLESDHPSLVFADSKGKTYTHDLSSVVREGCSRAHFSVRVHGGYACQSDCLINNSDQLDAGAFRAGRVKGIRFQPFYLPECSGNPDALRGQGLLFRGLHFPGIVTPGNVSASCVCDDCGKSFRLQSFHAGFGNSAYFYCSRGTHTLVIGSSVAGAPVPLTHPDPVARASLESRLPPCSRCGGSFRYLNPLLCPHCRRPFIDFARFPEIRDGEYYGNSLYGDRVQEWDEASA